MMKKNILFCSAIFGLSGAAFAQNSFEGFYAQLGSGYEENAIRDTSATSYEAPGTPSLFYYAAPNKSQGNMPLVAAFGYMYSVKPKYLFGFGMDYSALTQGTSSYNSIDQYDATLDAQHFSISQRLDLFLTPAMRIGNDALLYLKAGYSLVKISQSANATFNGDLTYSDFGYTNPTNPRAYVSGYVIGAGYKKMISNKFYGFSEVNFYSYAKKPLNITTTGNGGINSNTVTPQLNTYQLLLGIGYQF
jgi:opacity protein-like surface antigen